VEIAPFRGLADVPEIENKRPIHIGLEVGGSAELQIPYIEAFAEKTGVPVTYEMLSFEIMYSKFNLELVSDTGAYDIIYVETNATNEWARYLWTVDDLAELYDPNGVAGLHKSLEGHDASMLRCASDRDGNLKGIPYYTFNMFQYIRQDVFDDPTEQANFKAKYGYELAPATTWDQLYDQGEFFTRKEGDLLKGEVLEHDTYGVALMGGKFQTNDEISSWIWGMGGRWARLIRDDAGNPIEYVITKKDTEILREALGNYLSLMKFASPGCKAANWDFVSPQLAEGFAMIAPTLFAPLDQWCATMEDIIPGAEYKMYQCIGNKGYHGNFFQCIPLDARNPEAAYWLMRYVGSPEFQRDAGEEGWSSVRRDIYQDPKYEAEEWRTLIGMRARTLLDAWDNYHTAEDINDYVHFTSVAAFKIYEQQILQCHEAVTGLRSIDESVDYILDTHVELQTKFGALPIRVE
ncbi:MAG: extracellular solute-binding protein, partial [Desulfobacteraceae bacterium]|nr:extracellular solute-binding protein [Desulfobacteraceae bacterium]